MPSRSLALGPEALFDAQGLDRSLAARLDDPAVVRAIWPRAGALLGVEESWEEPWTGAAPASRANSAIELASNIADSIAGWALCVEFVHDLRRLPREERLLRHKSLPRTAVTACQQLAGHLRRRHAALYVSIADENEARLGTEVAHATAADLGKIDTFRFEDRTVLAASLDALGAGAFEAAYELATERTAADSFWPALVRGRQIAWNLVELAAQLGRAVDHTKLLGGARSLAEAVEWYATGAALELARQQLGDRRSRWPRPLDVRRLHLPPPPRRVAELGCRLHRLELRPVPGRSPPGRKRPRGGHSGGRSAPQSSYCNSAK